jgi:hypothetical protein
MALSLPVFTAKLQIKMQWMERNTFQFHLDMAVHLAGRIHIWLCNFSPSFELRLNNVADEMEICFIPIDSIPRDAELWIA